MQSKRSVNRDLRKRASQSANPLFNDGTRDENRTRTGLLPRDFKSLASTSSATRAMCKKFAIINAILSYVSTGGFHAGHFCLPALWEKGATIP